MRFGVARIEIPQAFALTGGLVIVFSVVAAVAFRQQQLAYHLGQLTAGVAFLVAAQVLGRGHFRARTMMWTWSVACVLLVVTLLVESLVARNQVLIAYALMILTAFAPVTLAWRPTIVGGALMFTGFVVDIALEPAIESPRLLVAAAAGFLLGGILLRLRLVTLDALSDERARSDALASTDVLTELLSRHGLLSLMPVIAGQAERMNQHLCMVYVDVDDLSIANEQYGMRYGDDVLRAVGKAIQGEVRLGDLVSRWGGDEFLVAGLGDRPSADGVAQRIQEAVRMSGVNLGKWPTSVHVGTAAGNPAETTFERLLAEAERQVQQA